MASKTIKVLIVDDSALVRKMITDTLQLDPEIEVVGVANDPLIAMEKIPRLKPDVLTLDMLMPRMDGLTFLRKLRSENSTLPVVVISSLTQQGSQLALDALEAGAQEVLAKPDGQSSIGALAGKLAFYIKAAYRARRPGQSGKQPVRAASVMTPARPVSPVLGDRRLIVIGSSTGGVEALRYLLPALPDQLPPIVVVQHIPAYFSKAVANRINALAPYEVREAVDGELLRPGLCLLAPGDYHLMIVKDNGYRTRLLQTPPVHHCRPAVDILFRSAASAAGPHVLAVLLTGMGSDGALGMQAIQQAGGHTLAEAEETCVIFGMPRAALELNAVDRCLPLDQIPQAIMDGLSRLRA
ncbi:MAG: chemotaxis response regulator protein-glutamate methylesterase [Cyanobacteria bacterium]|nr:chemotaxis response regulator protein-glutamate methylesterase [Cyanobacteriota bacterium]